MPATNHAVDLCPCPSCRLRHPLCGTQVQAIDLFRQPKCERCGEPWVLVPATPTLDGMLAEIEAEAKDTISRCVVAVGWPADEFKQEQRTLRLVKALRLALDHIPSEVGERVYLAYGTQVQDRIAAILRGEE